MRRRPARIIHVVPSDLARGAQVVVRDLCDALGPDDEHLALSIFGDGGSPGRLRADVALAVPSGWGRALGFSARGGLALRRELARQGPDVVVAHGGEALKYVAVATPRSTPVVYNKLGASAHVLSGRATIAAWRLLVRRARVVVAISAEMVDESRELLRVPPSRVVLVANGRDPSTFHPPATDPVGTGPVRLIAVGALSVDKRPGAFIDVVARLRAAGVACEATLVGDGPLEAALAGPAGAAGVELLGRRSDVADLLRRADLLVLTSVVEGMPGVLIEAGLTALPVVTTAVPGARAVVKQAETGLVVPRDDPDALFDSVRTLATDPALRRRMGAAAREHCLASFSLDSSVAAWRAVIDRVLGRVGGPPGLNARPDQVVEADEAD